MIVLRYDNIAMSLSTSIRFNEGNTEAHANALH